MAAPIIFSVRTFSTDAAPRGDESVSAPSVPSGFELAAFILSQQFSASSSAPPRLRVEKSPLAASPLAPTKPQLRWPPQLSFQSRRSPQTQKPEVATCLRSLRSLRF